MTLKGGLDGLFPVAWGEFDVCSDHAPGQAFTIDGSYSLTVRQQAAGRDLLIAFEGTIVSDVVNFAGHLDVRLLHDGTPEVRLSGAGGDIVLSINEDGQIVARDRSGTWTCAATELQCVHDVTGERLPQ